MTRKTAQQFLFIQKAGEILYSSEKSVVAVFEDRGVMMYIKQGRESIKFSQLLQACSVQKTRKPGGALHFSKHNGSWPSADASAFTFSRELFL